MAVSTRPFSGMGSSMITSKAEIRSDATINRRSSPASYNSRTLPDETRGRGDGVMGRAPPGHR